MTTIGQPFAPGRSGNPAGRPRGIERLRRDIARELAPHAAELARMVVQRALGGDGQALAAAAALLTDFAPGRRTQED